MTNHHIHSTCHSGSAIENSKLADLHFIKLKTDGRIYIICKKNKTSGWKISRKQVNEEVLALM
jgi:hypothetical protein